MRSSPHWLTLAALVFIAIPASAADLAQIERKIAKEPKYRSGQPKFCLLVFGKEAETHVWIVKDGDHYYVDRNANGDLTDPGEHIVGTNSITIPAVSKPMPEGATRFANIRFLGYEGRYRLVIRSEANWQYYVGYDEEEPFVYGTQPANAPVVHIGGPLTLKVFGVVPKVVTPGRALQLDASVGTPGLGKGSFAAVGCGTLPPDIYPLAQVVCPTTPTGASAVIAKTRLDDL